MLTEEQKQHWREMLITFPLPPLYLPLGPYAIIMPDEQLEEIVEKLQDILNQRVLEEVHKVEEPEKPTNIIRTRPRRKNLVRR